MEFETPTRLPAHAEVEDKLSRSGSDVTTAEAHGLICGYLCSGKQDSERCIKALLGEAEAGDIVGQEVHTQLEEIFQESAQQLPSLDLDLQLLLPDEETELPIRAAALGDWCFGFLSGLQLAGMGEDSFQDEDVIDALDHFDDIANVDYEAVDFSETDEEAFMEVSEYVRMAVILVYQDVVMASGHVEQSERIH